jgi:hypothetical protein
MARSRDEKIKQALGSGYRVVGSSRTRIGAAEQDSLSPSRSAVVSSQSPGLEKLKAAIFAGEQTIRRESSSDTQRVVARSAEAGARKSFEDQGGVSSRSSLTGVTVETEPDPTDRRRSPIRHKALLLDDEVVGVSDKAPDHRRR